MGKKKLIVVNTWYMCESVLLIRKFLVRMCMLKGVFYSDLKA